MAAHPDDLRYGACDECSRVGYEVERCYVCGADVCPFCDHYCDEDHY